MVQLSVCNFCKQAIRNPSFSKSKFLDSLYFRARGGTGGNGLPKHGGIGGKGGNVVCVAKNKATLLDLRTKMKGRLFTAESGKTSLPHRLAGTDGEDKILEVPAGVTVFNEFGSQLGEMNEVGDTVVLAHGGSGGNAKNGWLGRQGEEIKINLELKLIADIGLVGFPNAGKSTFLKAISKAKPKIANYPFTTIKPNIGVIKFEDLRKITIADLPGLIEGAYRNEGMGHRFLRHVERTKLIAMIVDINGFQLSVRYPLRNCIETILLINKELELYKKSLVDKPVILLLNKMDVPGADQIYNDIKNKLNNLEDHIRDFPEAFQPEKVLKFHSILPISAKTSKEDINEVKLKIRQLLDTYAEEEKDFIEQEKRLMDKLKATQTEVGAAFV